MTAQSNAPVIIKRKKNVVEGGHHGGAWKVAYADFVTAMMAFFMLMWLLGATTEKQRKGIADYFNPTIPVVSASGGGSGAFGGDSVFSDSSLSQSGTGASMSQPTESRRARGDVGVSETEGSEDKAEVDKAEGDKSDSELAELEEMLRGQGGESMVSELMQRHVVTRLSDDGLILELFETEEAQLFDDAGAPTDVLNTLIAEIVPVLQLASNNVAVQSHVRSVPVVVRENRTWTESAARAERVRALLEGQGLQPERLARVTGFADRKPVVDNPLAKRNGRIEIVLLRSRL